MKKMKKLGALALVGLLLWQSNVEIVKATEMNENKAYEIEMLEMMELVSENEYLELYFDEEETDIAVRDKESGYVWFSNPTDISEDTVSTGYYQKVLKSQINLTYINESTQISTMNNYTDSIMDGQFEVERLQDGICITYTIGESVAFLRLPDAISEERMNLFLDKMESSQQKKVKRNYTLYNLSELTEEKKVELLEAYPNLEKESLYILRGGVKDYLKEELAEYFEQAGYSEQDYELDAKNVKGQDEKDVAWFKIPLTYCLEGRNLIVSINPEEVTYNADGYYLVEIDMLRYFGASMRDDGYIFVPDGSGALINFNNGKTTASSYGAQVFGQDKTMLYTSYYESQIDEKYAVKMPVFGIKEENKALFAIIENGAGYASIRADVAGKTTGYNDVYTSFNYLQYGSTSLDDVVGANSYYMYSEPYFEGDYSIRYSFLSEEKANYSGMAECYRNYLIQNDVLKQNTEINELPFLVEYIGAIDKFQNVLGVKYSSVVPLTTFAQAQCINETLEDAGIGELNVVYSGWMNDGLHGTAATELDIVSKLEKDGVALKDFVAEIAESDNKLYMTLDLQYVYKDKMLDGYSAMKYAPRYFDNTNIKVNQYGLASRVSEDIYADLISPFYVAEVAENIGNKLQKNGILGVNLGTVSWELYSDLLDKNYTDRQMAIAQNVSAMNLIYSKNMDILVDNANVYAWNNADTVINVPLFSNNYRIIDAEIPFYEMVLHGYTKYVGEALNLADDYQTTLLKCVESGAGLNYKWIYESNSILKETEYDYLYSVNYEAWIEKAIEDYTRLNEEIGYLQNEEIILHEILGEEVVKVTYGDGSIVYINYSNDSLILDGITIQALDYCIKKGGE